MTCRKNCEIEVKGCAKSIFKIKYDNVKVILRTPAFSYFLTEIDREAFDDIQEYRITFFVSEAEREAIFSDFQKFRWETLSPQIIYINDVAVEYLFSKKNNIFHKYEFTCRPLDFRTGMQTIDRIIYNSENYGTQFNQRLS
jgi:hypothetical protein